jgi:hypothetical protein
MKHILILILCTLLIRCKSGSDCSKFPSAFNSYDEAQQILSETSFNYTDKVNTGKSSWVRGASFYSCDKQLGFFVLETEKQIYVHKEMPIEVWKEFKDAQSFGGFYNSAIRGRYLLLLENSSVTWEYPRPAKPRIERPRPTKPRIERPRRPALYPR